MIEFCFLGINGSCQELSGGNTSLLVKGREGCVAVDVSCKLAAMVEAEPDVVVLTHEHIDHVYGLPSFLHQSARIIPKTPLREQHNMLPPLHAPAERFCSGFHRRSRQVRHSRRLRDGKE